MRLCLGNFSATVGLYRASPGLPAVRFACAVDEVESSASVESGDEAAPGELSAWLDLRGLRSHEQVLLVDRLLPLNTSCPRFAADGRALE